RVLRRLGSGAGEARPEAGARPGGGPLPGFARTGRRDHQNGRLSGIICATLGTAPPAPPALGAISPDGAWYWNGFQWETTLSPDGRFRWNGSGWQPVVAAQQVGPAWARPYASAKSRAMFAMFSLAAI